MYAGEKSTAAGKLGQSRLRKKFRNVAKKNIAHPRSCNKVLLRANLEYAEPVLIVSQVIEEWFSKRLSNFIHRHNSKVFQLKGGAESVSKWMSWSENILT